MLDGDRYFASFPDETATDRPAKARPLTPELLAALAELDRELRSFLSRTSEDASNEASDDRHP
jgi:hypothetical protein